MCNHYRLNEDKLPSWKEYIGWSLRQPNEPWASDVYPKRAGLIVRRRDGEMATDVKAWGITRTMPGKRPGSTIKKAVTNVRNLTSSFWKSTLAMAEYRCLVPFTTFAEPTAEPHPESGYKGEHWFTVPDAPVSAFAGIWRGGEYAFLTCAPNAFVEPYHEKAMPVILRPEDYEGWLSGDYQAACDLARPFIAEMGVETLWKD